MTLIDQPAAAMGRAAVEVTLENIRNAEYFQPKHMKLPTKLLLGDTCLKKSDKGKK